MGRVQKRRIAGAACAVGLASGVLGVSRPALGDQLPPGFLDQMVASNWDQAIGVTFAPVGGVASGRMFVWEKGGRVWNVENGVKGSQPVIDISEEVGNWRDYGLVGFTVDPDFSNNGYIYLWYVVDYYHLKHFGLPDYDPAANEFNHDTIGRLTRYTCHAADGFHTVDYSSRHVLLGETITTGLPILSTTHGVGCLQFSPDGTLLVSCGEGASPSGADLGGPKPDSSNTALADGIIRPDENIGAYRSQMLNSLSGKILRLDPATGDGVLSNPFFDPLNPRSARSRVWALGLRNPYRFSIKPGTGSTSAADAHPGTIFLGDVGWNRWEELNVVTGPGQNFGWPEYEGMFRCPEYFENPAPADLDAPNPLYGNGMCGPYFTFRDVLIDDTANPTPSFPNPCNVGEEIPASVARFVHHRPTADWRHGLNSRASTYYNNDPVVWDVGETGSPVQGPQFGGFAATGGLWYTFPDFPTPYAGTYFHGEYVGGWIRSFEFDAAGKLVEIRNFLPDEARHPVCLAMDPINGGLYYMNYVGGNAELRRIAYFGANNEPPLAAATVTPGYGASPLTVQFDGSASSDPEQMPLSYFWDFGDFSPPGRVATPTHVYRDDEDVTESATIVAKVMTLSPPNPLGGGSQYPDIILRNNVYPEATETDTKRQYDTFHYGDQGGEDWIGYTLPAARELRGMIFQEGYEFRDGGWFETLNLQARVDGVWVSLPYTCDPPYPGANGIKWESFELRFVTPVVADGIRLEGQAGGSAGFVSVGELRVRATPSTPGAVCRTATLTATDNVNFSSSATLTVSVNNTPPTVVITSPVDGSLYTVVAPTDPLPLTATISDAESSNADLTCRWQTILHHNDHIHPDPYNFTCGSTSTHLDPYGCDDQTYWYEVNLTVTDPQCLSTSTSVFLYPNCCLADFDNNGFVNGDDFDLYLVEFEAGNRPADINRDGFVNGDDFDQYLVLFEAGCGS